MEFCLYHPRYAREMLELFYETVHRVNQRDYTLEQCDAWAPRDMDLDQWNQSFLGHVTILAKEDGHIVGFGDMDPKGYLDRLYVRWNGQGIGIGGSLWELLKKAVPAQTYTTNASITAKPFFLQKGFVVVKEQKVIRRGIELTNFYMQLEHTNGQGMSVGCEEERHGAD